MTFNDYLQSPTLDNIYKNIAQARLHPGMQVNFWLFQDHNRVLGHIVEKNEDWQKLRHTKSYVR